MSRLSRRNKAVVTLLVAIILILLGYVARPLTESPRRSAKRVAAGTYVVEHVYDGDSLRLANGAGVRLVGIDTPERGQAFSEEGRSFAKELLEGKTVRLVPAKEPVDRYKRNLAYLYLEKDGKEVFANAQMVRHGYAYAWPYKPNTSHSEEILAAQKEAQAQRRGLWARKPRKLKYYIVEQRTKYSLTHRSRCPKLKSSRNPTIRFEDRLEAINYGGGAPPCRECRP